MQDDYRNICKIGRKTAGMTQERWAEALDISVESVRLYETGRALPADDTVVRMIEITGMSVLGYWHLQNKSRMASAILPDVDTIPLPQAVIQLILRIRDFADAHRTDALMEIAADGKIDALERETFDAIVEEMDGLVQAVMQLKYAEGE